jgi:uncharacterized membrane protein YfcA
MLSSFPVSVIVGTALGFLSGLGTGGGSLLILWLTLVLETPAQEARVMNLMFFLPCAIISSLFRKMQGNLKLGQIHPAILSGCIAAFLCSRLGQSLNTDLLKKLFGILLLVTGVRELTWHPKEKQT